MNTKKKGAAEFQMELNIEKIHLNFYCIYFFKKPVYNNYYLNNDSIQQTDSYASRKQKPARAPDGNSPTTTHSSALAIDLDNFFERLR